MFTSPTPLQCPFCRDHLAEPMREDAEDRSGVRGPNCGDHLKPAVAATGFELRAVAGPHAAAGSIEDRMRAELRTSRFVVCDLTHGNQGAYWQAGFAEGLGRPVFYVCRRDVAQHADRHVRPHFDTAHQLIVEWAHDTIEADMQRLKDAIRATLPAEAKLTD